MGRKRALLMVFARKSIIDSDCLTNLSGVCFSFLLTTKDALLFGLFLVL